MYNLLFWGSARIQGPLALGAGLGSKFSRRLGPGLDPKTLGSWGLACVRGPGPLGPGFGLGPRPCAQSQFFLKMQIMDKISDYGLVTD